MRGAPVKCLVLAVLFSHLARGDARPWRGGDGEGEGGVTSAASAAFLLASSCALPFPLAPLGPLPSVRAGPPTLRGTLDLGAVVPLGGFGFGGAEERTRPGWLKGEGSGSEVLQQFPILVVGEVMWGRELGGGIGCEEGVRDWANGGMGGVVRGWFLCEY